MDSTAALIGAWARHTEMGQEHEALLRPAEWMLRQWDDGALYIAFSARYVRISCAALDDQRD